MRWLTLRRDNPMNRTLALLLMFDIIVFVLAVPALIVISKVPVTSSALLAGGAALLALLGAALLRRGAVGFVFAWLTQIAALALGVLNPMMYVVGLIFAAIWVLSFVLGKRIESPDPEKVR